MRCAYCHDDLGAEHHRCEGCGTLLHFECGKSLAVCPTLGCALTQPGHSPIPIRVRELAGRVSGRRIAAWVVFGILLPFAAFILDTGMRADPLIWGDRFLTKFGGGFGHTLGPQPLPYARMALVWGATGLSMLGLFLFALRRTRAAFPLLCLGVVVSGAHALAFVPLIPISLVGILFVGLGLLGFLPFVTWWVFLDAAKRARARLAEDEDEAWSESLFVAEDSRLKRRALLFVGALLFAGACVLIPYPRTLHSPAASDLAGVDLQAARGEARLYLAAETPKELSRLENRLAGRFESFGYTTTPTYPLVSREAGRVRLTYDRGTSHAGQDDELAWSEPHWIWIMEDADELPPLPPGSRSVEFAPGVWSQWQHTPPERGQDPELQHLPLW